MVSCPKRYKIPQQNLINNLHALAVTELPDNETDSLSSATPQATVVAGSAPPVTPKSEFEVIKVSSLFPLLQASFYIISIVIYSGPPFLALVHTLSLVYTCTSHRCSLLS